MSQPGSSELQALLGQIFVCSEDVSQKIAGRSRGESFPPRAIILSFGAPCEHIYIVLEGLARARASSLDGRQAVLEDYGSATSSARPPWSEPVTASTKSSRSNWSRPR